MSILRMVARRVTASTIQTHRYSTQPEVFRTVKDLRKWRLEALKSDRTVGLVPTMGALHQGHLDLVERSLADNSSTIVSIFVNPSQFAPHEDLDKYPRTIEADLKALTDTAAGREIKVFMPTVSEMYPSGITLEVNEQRGAFVEVKGLSEQLEGSVRPQFFRGVATVVTKLLNAVSPDKAYFGQKDVQQSVVIQRLVKDLLIPSEIVVVPTAREPSGLAMSSRNAYLSDESREKASVLYKALSAGYDVVKNSQGDTSAKDILDAANNVLRPFTQSGSDFPVEIEYISLTDRTELKTIDVVPKNSPAILSGAIRVPNKTNTKTRIIDNVIIE